MAPTPPSDPPDDSDGGERYVVDETYEGELVITDQENTDAWIRSDVTWTLEE